MAHVILKKMRRYRTRGHLFERGRMHPVTPEVALAIENDPVQSERFKVHLSLAERNALAGRDTSQAQDAPPGHTAEDKDEPHRAGPEGKMEMTDEDKLEAIRGVIGDLDEDDETNWTNDGRPDARALTKVLGWQVTSDLRDRAIEAPDPEEPGPGHLESAEDHPRRNLRITRGAKAPTQGNAVEEVAGTPLVEKPEGNVVSGEQENDPSTKGAVEV